MKKLFLLIMIIAVLCVGCSQEVVSDDPEQIIKKYTKAISENDYSTLVELYGGDYEWMAGFSPESDRSDKEKIFENYLKVIPEKIYFNEIVDKEVVNEEEIIFTVTYKKEDGSLFDVGSTQSRSSRFRYTVKKMDGYYKVLDPPPYQA